MKVSCTHHPFRPLDRDTESVADAAKINRPNRHDPVTPYYCRLHACRMFMALARYRPLLCLPTPLTPRSISAVPHEATGRLSSVLVAACISQSPCSSPRSELPPAASPPAVTPTVTRSLCGARVVAAGRAQPRGRVADRTLLCCVLPSSLFHRAGASCTEPLSRALPRAAHCRHLPTPSHRRTTGSARWEQKRPQLRSLTVCCDVTVM